MNADEGMAGRGRRAPARAGLPAAVLAAAALLATGCGGRIPSAARQRLLRQMIKAAACMRTHGYPGWPDPALRNGQISPGTPTNIDMNSPQFQAAQKACGPA